MHYTVSDLLTYNNINRMTRRSLSKREADLILALEWEKTSFVSLKDIKRRLHCSDVYARYVAHVLRKKGWLYPLGKGHYQLIGAERGPKGVPEMNPYFIVRFFPKEYFLAYRWACEHHGLSTQVPTVIPVAVRHPKSPMEFKNVRFEFIVLTRKRFFGFEEVSVQGQKVRVSDLERTLLDSFDRPDLVGGIEVAAQAMFHAWKKNPDQIKLIAYLKRMGDSGLSRRIGYLAEVLKLRFSDKLAAYLRSQVKKDPVYLGSPKRWGSAGDRDPRWNLIVNVQREELLGEVHIG